MNDMDSTTEPKDVGVAKRTWKGHSLGFWLLEAISAFARFYMAYIWISAGSAKLNQHLSVTQTIEGYEIFTPEWSSALAHLIGPLEIAGGVFLLLGLFLKPAGSGDGARAVYHGCRVRLGAWADDRLRLLHCRYQRIGSGYELFTHNPAGCVLYLLKRVDCAQAFPTLSYLSVGGRLSLTETFSLARTNEEQGG